MQLGRRGFFRAVGVVGVEAVLLEREETEVAVADALLY
jgi:hypothetical protein